MIHNATVFVGNFSHHYLMLFATILGAGRGDMRAAINVNSNIYEAAIGRLVPAGNPRITFAVCAVLTTVVRILLRSETAARIVITVVVIAVIVGVCHLLDAEFLPLFTYAEIVNSTANGDECAPHREKSEQLEFQVVHIEFPVRIKIKHEK